MSNTYKPSLWRRVRQWYNNNFVPYLSIQQNNEHFFVSRVLFESIINDLPLEERRFIRIFFKKYWLEKEGRYEYIMIVNPVLKEELEESVWKKIEDKEREREEFEARIKDLPNSKKMIETMKYKNALLKDGVVGLTLTDLQLNIYGHIGFQCTQPSPAEIVYQYRLEEETMRKYKTNLDFYDRVSIKVKPIAYRPEIYGKRHAYVLTDCIIDRPLRVAFQTMEQRKQAMEQRRHAMRRARGVQYRNARMKK